MAIKLKEPLDVEVKQPASQAQQTVDQTPAQEAPTVSASKSSNTAGTRTATTSSPATTSAKNSTGFVSSPALEQAYALLQQQQANKPGNYTPIWQDEADAYLSQYENRGPFAYDVTKDALYNQYKDIYVNQGQLASMDVMGQAAAMTGGYGNSYVQSVGQQAYNQYLSQLNAVVPELHQMAHDRYTQDGQQMLNMYDLYLNRENQEYAKHQDSLDRWYQEVARLQSDYDSQYAKEYAKYRDDVADQQWLKSFNRSVGSYTGNEDGGDLIPTYELTENAQALLNRIPFTWLDKNSAAWKDAKNQQMLKETLLDALEKGRISEEELADIVWELKLDTFHRSNN